MPPFDACSAALAGERSGESRRESGCYVLTEMQQALRADILKEDTKPAERAQLMRAYVDAEKLKRVIRGQPANTSQSIREPAAKKQSKASVSPLESLPETKPKE